MKVVMMIAALGLALTAAPALAGGKSNGLNIGAGAVVSTGKGGLLGSVLGSGYGSSKTVVAANVKVSTGKGGLLGGLLGGGKSGGNHGGW